MKKILIIINTNTDNYHKAVNLLFTVIKICKDKKYNLINTNCVNEINRINFNDYDNLIIVGGDGTISYIIQKIIKNRLPIGCIPSGSGNGLIHSILSENKNDFNLINIINKITNSEIKKRIDTMEIYFPTTKKFLNSFLFLSYGIFSNIDVGTDYLRSFGTIRFTIGAIIELIRKKSFFGKLEYYKYDRWITVEGNFVYFMANNLSHTSKKTMTSPFSKSNDGLIFICYIMDSVSRYELFNILTSLYDGSFIKYPSVKYFSTTEFKFYTNESILDIDGETYNSQPIHVKIKPKSLTILN